jgi:thiosulfate/3-mercaptopyruvate sulfurtransferase
MKLASALVSTQWLADNLGQSNLRIFDTSISLKVKEGGGYIADSGYDRWCEEHIPGAGFLDLANEFADQNTDIPFTMLSPDEFCERAAGHGISDSSAVVLYCNGMPMWATRAWWMFRSVGFDNVAILDGGWQKWRSEGRAVDNVVPDYPTGKLTADSRPELWADKKDMQRIMEDASACTLNALPPDVYNGETNRYGRAGHIPGSHSVFCGNLIDSDNGTFRPVEVLREQFSDSGALEAERTIVYCGGGISATIDALALHLIGHSNIAIYDGSMSEWVKDESLPLTMGDKP